MQPHLLNSHSQVSTCLCVSNLANFNLILQSRRFLGNFFYQQNAAHVLSLYYEHPLEGTGRVCFLHKVISVIILHYK